MRKKFRKAMPMLAAVTLAGSCASAWAVNPAGYGDVPYLDASWLDQAPDSARNSGNGSGLQFTYGVPVTPHWAVETQLYVVGREGHVPSDHKDFQRSLLLNGVRQFDLSDLSVFYLPDFKPFLFAGVGGIDDNVLGKSQIDFGLDFGGGLLIPLGFHGASLRFDAAAIAQTNGNTGANQPSHSFLDYNFGLGLEIPLTFMRSSARATPAPRVHAVALSSPAPATPSAVIPQVGPSPRAATTPAASPAANPATRPAAVAPASPSASPSANPPATATMPAPAPAPVPALAPAPAPTPTPTPTPAPAPPAAAAPASPPAAAPAADEAPECTVVVNPYTGRKSCVTETRAVEPPGDADHDGVPDAQDACPNTMPGFSVDSSGCVLPQITIVSQLSYTMAYAGYLDSDTRQALDQVVAMLKGQPNLFIEIDVYCDDSRAPDEATELTRERAYAIAGYLLSKGIDRTRINPQGEGAAKPLVPNDSENNRDRNRRVEFKISVGMPPGH